VKQHFERAPQDDASQIATLILDGVQQFVQKTPHLNDVTALALVRRVQAAAA
jgi:hypothetical protein